MILSELQLVNFRNYKKKTFTFGDTINIFVGKNGVGKTNILEAIYVLGLTKSYKNIYSESLIHFGSEYFMIKGLFKKDKLTHEMMINLNKRSKKAFYNKTQIKRLANYIGLFKVIMYAPTDNDIIRDAPSLRRNLIDTSISQVSNKYLNTLNEYNHLIKLKNDYLKELSINGNADVNYLKILNRQIASRMVIIYQVRLEYIDHINELMKEISPFITIGSNIKIDYKSSIEGDLLNEEYLYKYLNKIYQKEMRIGSSLYGPHRDDLIFLFNNLEMKLYSSQGEQKLALLAYKLAECEYIKSIYNYYPALLLDDLFSEIDKTRLNKIINYLTKRENIQVFISSNDTIKISKKLLNKAKVEEIY